MLYAISVGSKTVSAQTPNNASPGSPHYKWSVLTFREAMLRGCIVYAISLLIKFFRQCSPRAETELKKRQQLYDSAEIKTPAKTVVNATVLCRWKLKLIMAGSLRLLCITNGNSGVSYDNSDKLSIQISQLLRFKSFIIFRFTLHCKKRCAMWKIFCLKINGFLALEKRMRRCSQFYKTQ